MHFLLTSGRKPKALNALPRLSLYFLHAFDVGDVQRTSVHGVDMYIRALKCRAFR